MDMDSGTARDWTEKDLAAKTMEARRLPVEERLAELSKGLAVYAEHLSVLTNRLGSVLVPRDDVRGDTLSDPRPNASDLTTRLWDMGDELAVLNDRLADVIARIEV